ncbi:unnamed protein product, partial [Heterosigma akashiwo]
MGDRYCSQVPYTARFWCHSCGSDQPSIALCNMVISLNKLLGISEVCEIDCNVIELGVPLFRTVIAECQMILDHQLGQLGPIFWLSRSDLSGLMFKTSLFLISGPHVYLTKQPSSKNTSSKATKHGAHM